MQKRKVKGYYYNQRDGLYYPRIRFKGKRFYLKACKTEEEAEELYDYAVSCINKAHVSVAIPVLLQQIRDGIEEGQHRGAKPEARFMDTTDYIRARCRPVYDDAFRAEKQAEYYRLRTGKDEYRRPLISYKNPYELSGPFYGTPEISLGELESILDYDGEDSDNDVPRVSLRDYGIGFEEISDLDADPLHILETSEDLEGSDLEEYLSTKMWSGS